MKTTVLRRVLPLLLTALVLLAVLVSCTPETDIGNNTELAGEFMDHVVAGDYTAAYAMVQATVTDTDFRPYWQSIQTAVEGTETYEMQQIGWNVNRSNGVTTRTTAYQVYLDNDRVILLRVVTQDGIEGIAGIHFSDITDFIRSTDTYVPVLQAVVFVVSLLCMAFTVWMFVDCLRRKMKYKVLWAILVVFGIALNITVGETASFSFNVGLFVQMSTVEIDPGLVAVVTELVIPVGAILYLCLRKKFTVQPPKPEEEAQTDPFAPADTAAPAVSETESETQTETAEQPAEGEIPTEKEDGEA